jgi:hypothetical protein
LGAGIKPGWNYACGEFGAEGLDFEDVMRERISGGVAAEGRRQDEAAWTPARIHKSQTGGHYHLWIEPGRTMAEWVRQ